MPAEERLPIASMISRETQTVIETEHGSDLHALPLAEDASNIRGFTADMVIIDESAEVSDEAMSAISPMLIARDGKLMLISTPRGMNNFFAKAFHKPQQYGFKTYSFPSTVRFKESQLKGERQRMPDIQFRQEYCYHSETEFLTMEGWKKYPEITSSELLGCYNKETFELEYHPFTNRIEKESKDLIIFGDKSKPIIAVTPEHRIWHGKDSHNPDEFIFRQAKECSDSINVIDQLTWQGSSINTINIPKEIFACNKCGFQWSKRISVKNKRACRKCFSTDMKEIETFDKYKGDWFFQFMGYLISEGYISKSTKPTDRKIVITQKEGWKAKEMSKVLDKWIRPQKRNGYVYWSKYDKNLYYWLATKVGIGSANKRIPKFMLFSSKEQMQLLINALILGDGWKETNSDGLNYGTINKLLADDISELGFKLGYSVYQKQKKNNMWHVSFTNSAKYRWLKKGIWKDYNGKVYCFNVPTGLLVTRFNGRVSIQGNCAEFVESSGAMFTITELEKVMNSDICPYRDNPLGQYEYYLGYDPSRFGEDEAYGVIVEKRPKGSSGFDAKYTYALVNSFFFKKSDMPEQIKTIKDWHRRFKFRKILIDTTGLGTGIIDPLFNDGLPVEGYEFTVKSKQEAYFHMKRMIEGEEIILPADSKLKKQMLDLRREQQAGTNFTKISPPRHVRDDYITALVLAGYAAGKRPADIAFGVASRSFFG